MTTVDFEKVVPIIFREGHLLVNRRGDISYVFEYVGRPICSLDLKDFDALSDAFALALTFLPNQSILHKQDLFTKDKFSIKGVKEEDFLSQRYLDLYNGRPFLRHRSYITITQPEGLSIQRNYTAGLQDASVEEMSFEAAGVGKMSARIDAFKRKLQGWEKFMEDSGMAVKACDETTVDDLLTGYFALFDDTVYGDIDFDLRRVGLRNFDIMAMGSGSQFPDQVTAARLNPKYVRFADMKGETPLGVYGDYFSRLGYYYPFDHILNQYFFLDGKDFWRGEIGRRRKNFGAWRFFSPQNGFISDSLAEFEQEVMEDNGLIMRFHVNVMFWHDREPSWSEPVESLRSAFKELGITAREASRENIKLLFLAGCPGNGGVFPEEDTIIGMAGSFAALALKERTSVYPVSPHTERKGLLFTDRTSGALMERDCWFEPYQKKQIANRNFLGIGKSGSGKSSMTIEILRQYLLMDFNITVLDIGRSFEILAKHYDGNYIVYEDGLGLGVNPFAFEGREMSSSMLEFLAQFTSVLWRPNTALTDDETSALEKIILSAYGAQRVEGRSGFEVTGDFKNTTIEYLYSYIADNEKLISELIGKDTFFDRDSFLLSMEKFVKGKFDQLFTKNVTLDTNKNLTVWELDNIKDHKTLFPILSMLITYLTTEVIWKKTSQEKIVLIEEAWKMVEKPGMASYIKWLYKTIRKFDGAVGINIQQIGDINVPNTNIKETILANSDVKFIMAHEPSMAKELARVLDWDDQQLGLLLSIPLDERKIEPDGRIFSELLSIVGNDVKDLKLLVSDEQAVNFMSEMKDKTRLFELVKETDGNWEKAINKYVSIYKKK